MDASTLLAIAIAFVIAFIILKRILSKGDGGTMNIGAKEAQELIRRDGVTVLDVRTDPEYDRGHIQGSIHIPLSSLPGRLGEIESAKINPLVVYCQSGGRSLTACRILSGSGFTQVRNLQGGISSWSSSGNLVVRD